MKHRNDCYALLAGDGIDIGALHEPAPLPAGCRVRYVDAMSRAEAIERFPEIDHAALVHPDFICNLDRDALPFPDGALDFVVLSHVIEHVANPVRVIGEVFRVLRPGGRALIAAPDKRFTFDRTRAITPVETLLEDFLEHRTEVPDERYLDFLRGAGAHVFDEPPERLPGHVARARSRREHCSVWDSAAFRRFLEASLRATGSQADPLVEHPGDETQLEYCGVWEKRAPSLWNRWLKRIGGSRSV